MITSLITALFRAIVGGVTEYFRDARRDASLRELGHAENEIENLKAQREEWKNARDVYRKHGSSVDDIDDILGRL